MDEDFRQYVYRRCEKALVENKEYMEMEHEDVDQDAIQAKAEELCYMRGWADAMALSGCR
jgi:hypothetical protein